MSEQDHPARSVPVDIQRYERQAKWRDFTTPISRLNIGSDWRILDVGCGSGVATRLLAQHAHSGFVVGLDALAEHVVAARRLAPNVAAGVGAFVAGDARRLPFADGSFDLIWSSFVLEYLGSTAVATLRELARVVRPGGTVAVFDVDGFLLHHDPIDPNLANRIARWRAFAIARGFDPEIGHKLPAYFAEAGLTDVQSETFPDPELYPIGRSSDAILDAWEQRLAGMRGIALALGSEAEADRFRRDYLDLLRQPERRTFGANWLVWGKVSQRAI